LDIIKDVLSGLTENCQVQVIEDRKRAVLETLAQAQVNDVVLFAGKGHEDYIILGNEKIDYNERDVVSDFFENYELLKPALTGESQ